MQKYAEAKKVTERIELSPIPRRWHSGCQYDNGTQYRGIALCGDGKVRHHETFAEMCDPASL